MKTAIWFIVGCIIIFLLFKLSPTHPTLAVGLAWVFGGLSALVRQKL
jgi:hypothetical protein